MDRIAVYPGDLTPSGWETAKLGHGLGLLPDAIQPRIRKTINGDWSLTLRYPLHGRGAELLRPDRLILAQGQLWRVLRLAREDGGGIRALSVEAPHLAYDLRDSVIENIETAENPDTLDGITAQQALSQLLAGTPFVPGISDVPTGTLDYLDILQKNRMECLKDQLLPKWGGELVFDNWVIHLRAQSGLDRRYPIRRGRNLKAIAVTEDITETITRLHVRGYQGANFESINGGKDYIDSPRIAAYGRVKEGYADFPDDDLPEDLMRKALEYLPAVDTPRVTYDIDLAALRNTRQYALYAPLEEFGLGDTALIHHDFFDTDILARCVELEQDALTGANLRVVLGNHSKDLYGALSASQKTAERVSAILTPDGRVRGEKLQGTLDLLGLLLRASGSYANAQVIEDNGMLLQNTNETSPDYGSLYLGPAVLALANARKPDSSWDWSAAITPRGIAGEKLVARSVTASALAADVGQSLDLSSNVSITSLVEQVAQSANGILVSAEAPATPAMDALWLDTSDQPHVLKRWNGAVWEMTGADASLLDALESRLNQQESDLMGKAALTDLGAKADMLQVQTLLNSFVSQTAQDITQRFDQANTYTVAVDGRLEEFKQLVYGYQRFTASGLELGKSDSPFKAMLGNTKLSFTQNGVEIAYFSNNKLYVTQAEVSEKLTMGSAANGFFDWVTEATGLSLRWRDA